MKKTMFPALVLATLALGACSYDRSPEGHYDPEDTGFEYAPEGDMYYYVSYNPLSEVDEDRNSYNPNAQSVRYPAQGTIARGQLDYIYPHPNTPAGYIAAAAYTNPSPEETPSLAKGKLLYEAYCWQCHGKEGAKASLVAAGKFPPPTWEIDRIDHLKTLPVGQMFHSISFGKGLMGPHNFILEPQERWAVINYLKAAASGAAAAPAAGTPATGTPAPAGGTDTAATAAPAGATTGTTGNATGTGTTTQENGGDN